MKLRNTKIQFYSTPQKQEQLIKAAASLRRSVGWLYDDVIAKLDENIEIPESYFARNGGLGRTACQLWVSQEVYAKLTRMAGSMKSVTGQGGARAAIARYVGDDILARIARGEYEPKEMKTGCVQIVVSKSMHEKMEQLFPRKFIPERDEWSGGISRHVRKVIREFTVENFPEERVLELYKEFVGETSGLHTYSAKNKQALLGKDIRPYAVELFGKEKGILDEICKGKRGAKAALCYYAYKLAYERATQGKAEKQSLKRVVAEVEIPHECGMELPGFREEAKPQKVPENAQKVPENTQKELKKELQTVKKDVQVLKIDVGLLKSTQKQLIWAIKRLNAHCFSRKKPIRWIHVWVIWTIATILATLGVVSLVS